MCSIHFGVVKADSGRGKGGRKTSLQTPEKRTQKGSKSSKSLCTAGPRMLKGPGPPPSHKERNEDHEKKAIAKKKNGGSIAKKDL